MARAPGPLMQMMMMPFNCSFRKETFWNFGNCLKGPKGAEGYHT